MGRQPDRPTWGGFFERTSNGALEKTELTRCATNPVVQGGEG